MGHIVCSRDAPFWTIHPYVFDGYRPRLNWSQCVYSLVQWHTETINVWTMVGNMVITVYLLHPLFSVSQAAVAMALAVCVHNPCSVVFHTFMPVSEYTYRCLYKLDACCIFVASFFLTFSLASCVFSPALVFAFSSAQACIVIYSIMQMLAASTFLPPHTQGYFIARCMVMYLAPMMYHTVVVDTGTWVATSGTLVSFAVGGVSYMVGFPQIIRPATTVFNSHALMHCCLVSAQYFMTRFLLSQTSVPQ